MSFIRSIIRFKYQCIFGLLLFFFVNPNINAATHTYVLTSHGQKFICSVGKLGFKKNKKEGDLTTPIGTFYLREIFYRPDHIHKDQIQTSLPLKPIQKKDGWCDDAASTQYNRLIRLPFEGSYESLWRTDHVHDVIVVVGYNDQPPIKGKGSAIFLHVASPNYKPTSGCIAFSKKDLLNIVKYLTPQSRICITPKMIKIF